MHKPCKCGKYPSFGYKHDMKRIACKYCKNNDMVNIDGIRRTKCKCGKKRPYYGFIDDKKPTRCISCKDDDMIDILTKRTRKLRLCQCKPQKRASFGYLHDERPTCCKKCKKSGMVDIVSKKCFCGSHQPIFGYPNDKTSTHCKKSGMVNIKSKKCESCGLFVVTYPPFLCSYCNPNSKHKYSTIEMKTVRYLSECKSDFPLSTFTHNSSTGFVCGDYRPDILYDCGTYFIVVEIDEQQHKHISYNCEIVRMFNIEQSLGLHTIFIRYNPHKYIIDGKTKKTTLQQRLSILQKTIESEMSLEYKKRDNSIKTIYLFYDNIKHNHKNIIFQRLKI